MPVRRLTRAEPAWDRCRESETQRAKSHSAYAFGVATAHTGREETMLFRIQVQIPGGWTFPKRPSKSLWLYLQNGFESTHHKRIPRRDITGLNFIEVSSKPSS